MVTNLILIGAFVAIALLTFLIGRSLQRMRRDPIRERLESFVRSTDPTADVRSASPFVESLAEQLPQSHNDNGLLDRELRQGGFYAPHARKDYLAIRNGLVIAAVVVTGIIAIVIGPERQELVIRVLIGGAIVAGLAWAIPRLILRSVIKRRLARIRQGLPYALDMITMCTAGGISLRDALVQVGREIFSAHPDLAVELVILRQHTELNSLEFALQQFATRINLPEISAVAALMSQTHRLGVNAAATLQEYADIIRQKWRQEADERANAAGIKLLFPVVLCLLPSAMILLWGPAVIDLTKFLEGGMQAVQGDLEPLPGPGAPAEPTEAGIITP